MSVELTTDSSLRTDFENTIDLIKTEYNFLSSENLNNKPFSNEVKKQYADLAQEFLTILVDKNIPYFLNNPKAYYRLGHKINETTITLSLIRAINSKNKSFKDFGEDDLELFKEINLRLKQIFYNFQESIDIRESAEQLLSELKSDIEKQVSSTFEGIERAKLAFENDKIASAYKKIYEDLDLSAMCYQFAFWGALATGGACAAVSMNQYPNFQDGNFWFSKILIFSLTITFATYFVSRASHLRKQSDQLKREAWEMDALPIFISSLDQQSQSEVIKDLVPKYFGKEIDQSINNKMADLMNEQIRTSLEVFKTGTEIVKSLKPSVAKDENGTNKE